MDCNAVWSETGLAQSSHIWDGGCSVIFSWKGFCNIDKESYHDALWTWTWIRPPWLYDGVCVCVVLVHLVFVLQQHRQYALFFVFFAREIWRAIYRPALSMCFPPFLSFTLSSFPPRFMMLLDSPSSSHTFLPLNSRFFFSSVVVLSSYSVSSALFLCVVPRCFRTIVPPSFPVDFCLWIINGCWMAVTGSNAKIQSSYGG